MSFFDEADEPEETPSTETETTAEHAAAPIEPIGWGFETAAGQTDISRRSRTGG